MAAKQPSEAERVLSLGIEGREADPSPDVRGEVALWLAHRATARTQLHRNMEAESDLQRGLSSGPRDWVRGRIHAQLGDLQLAAGARTRAQHEFDAAVEFSGRGGDRAAVTEARRKLDRLKRQQE